MASINGDSLVVIDFILINEFVKVLKDSKVSRFDVIAFRFDNPCRC